MPKAKANKRLSARSKDPKDRVRYHVSQIKYNIVDRLYNTKTETFYLGKGDSRDKLKYVLSKITYHVEELQRYKDLCIFEETRPASDRCQCKEERKKIRNYHEVCLEKLDWDVDRLQDTLKRIRHAVERSATCFRSG